MYVKDRLPHTEFVWKTPHTQTIHTDTVFIFTYVSTMFVEKHMKNLERRKDTSNDNQPNGILKDCSLEISKPLTCNINLLLKTR